MTKVFCDTCGAEAKPSVVILFGYARTLKERENMLQYPGTLTGAELCQGCAEKAGLTIQADEGRLDRERSPQ